MFLIGNNVFRNVAKMEHEFSTIFIVAVEEPINDPPVFVLDERI
jgi:hypothetical protein